jgi:hypothetical protein
MLPNQNSISIFQKIQIHGIIISYSMPTSMQCSKTCFIILNVMPQQASVF